MRFCPFCAHENADDAAQCGKCGKRLPPPRPAARAGRDGEAPTASGRPSTPSNVTPKPNLPSRPGGLHPKSPLRARVEAARAAGSAPAAAAPRAEMGASRSARAVPAPPEPARPRARTGSQPLVPPPPVPSLPPPPGDYKAPMHTPTAVREVTGNAPRVSPPSEEHGGLFEPAGQALVPLPSDGQSDTVTVPQASLTPIDRARLMAQRGANVVRRGVDIRAVRYVISTARDTMKKKSEIARLRKLNIAEQQKLDAVLAELGKQARAANLGVPALADEMRATKTLEAEREAARSRIAELEKRRAAEQEHFQREETNRQAAIAQGDHLVAQLSEELAGKVSERAGHRTAMNRLDAQLKSLGRQMQAKEAAALKATAPAQQSTLRGEVQAMHAQVAALEPQLDKFAERAAELDQPIADLEARLTAAQEQASLERRELGEAARAHQATIAQIAAEVEAESKRISHSERELSLKFVTLGTLLNLNRVQSPSFEPLYREFDELKRVSSERDIEVGRLEAEIQAVDRKLFTKGVVVLVVSLFVLLVLVAILVR